MSYWKDWDVLVDSQSHSCNICYEKFNNLSELCAHLRSKHLIVPAVYVNTYYPNFFKKSSTKFWIDEYKHKTRKDGIKYTTITEDGKRKRYIVHEQKYCQYVNRQLEDWECLYHIDYNPSNNDIDNIALIPFADVPSKRSKSASGKHSRNKGKRKEREVAKLIEKWWEEGSFRPTPDSGAWDREGCFQMKGDIVATDPNFPFCVEIKNDESWKFSTSIMSDNSALHRFWGQTIGQLVDAETANFVPIPLLLFTRNYHPLFVAIENILADHLKPMYGFRLAKGSMDCYITLFDEFKKNSRQEIIEAISSYHKI